MWGTSQGDRTLMGDEANLVRQSVGYLRDMITAGIDLNEPYQTAVGVFNRLQPTQQLAVLHEVAYGLLDPSTRILELTAVREATVYAIYLELISLIEIEIELAKDKNAPENDERFEQTIHHLGSQNEGNPGFHVRSSIVAACQSCNWYSDEWGEDEFSSDSQELSKQPNVETDDIGQWSLAIEFLADQVLWDRDFEMEEIFADHDPAKIADIKQYFGIHQDYFSTPAPDANSNEYQRIDRELVDLTQNPDVQLGENRQDQ